MKLSVWKMKVSQLMEDGKLEWNLDRSKLLNDYGDDEIKYPNGSNFWND